MRFTTTVLFTLVLLLGNVLPASADLGDQFRTFILGTDTPSRPQQTQALQLDTIAQGCMQCHDGSHASHITIRRSGSPMHIRGSQTLNHPVGMVYDDTVRKDPQEYRARAALHPNIQLVNGQVTCVSCHQLRTAMVTATNTAAMPDVLPANNCTATKELTTGHGDRALCMACHIK